MLPCCWTCCYTFSFHDTNFKTWVQRNFSTQCGKGPPIKQPNLLLASKLCWDCSFGKTSPACQWTSLMLLWNKSDGAQNKIAFREITLRTRLLSMYYTNAWSNLALVQQISGADKVTHLGFFTEKLNRIGKEEISTQHNFNNNSTFHISCKVNSHNCIIWDSSNPITLWEHIRNSPKESCFFLLPAKMFEHILFLTVRRDGLLHYQQVRSSLHFHTEVRDFREWFSDKWTSRAERLHGTLTLQIWLVWLHLVLFL